MRQQRLQRGATLIEAMAAMFVLMVGAAGAAGLNTQSMFFMADSRQATRAGGFAQDLAAQIELWDYADPRLANTSTANDADPTFELELDHPATPTPLRRTLAQMAVAPDHGEADLTLGGAAWTGMPNGLLVINEMERYWSVSYVDDANGNGQPDGVRVAVIVRWAPAHSRSWRFATFFVVKPNPADFL
jgi:hypothetical protein